MPTTTGREFTLGHIATGTSRGAQRIAPEGLGARPVVMGIIYSVAAADVTIHPALQPGMPIGIPHNRNGDSASASRPMEPGCGVTVGLSIGTTPWQR